MFPKSHLVFLATLLLTTTQLSAQMITDGTLGRTTNLTGPNFQIPAHLGQQLGGNLFHSFKEFNIDTGQSATFTGPTGSEKVQNILTRVTGGQRSWIDGPLRSEIPNANLYLLNPSGIFFGKNARLDISGAFYASTADGVNLEGGGKFLARSPNDSVLTTAQPSDFGFLDSQPASIEIQGGSLAIRNHTYYAPNGQINVATDGNIHLEDSTLYAPNGQIKITTPGELRIVQTSQNLFKQFDINADGQPEMIANLDVSGLQGGGNITIRANSFVSEKGWMFADIWGDKGRQQKIDLLVNQKISLTKGAGITADNLSPTMGKSGSITIEAKELQLEGPGELVGEQSFFPTLIATDNYSSGQGGNITLRHINAVSLTNSSISASAESTGDAGSVLLEEIHNLTLNNGGRILGYNAGGGNAGTIKITADNISLFQDSYMGTWATEGNGGSVGLTAQRLYLVDSSITASTFSSKPQAGAGKVKFKGRSYSFAILNNSQILATAKAGPGGNISIIANQYLPSSDSVIDTSSEFNIDGQVLINAPGLVNFNGIFAGLPRTFPTLALSLSRCSPFSKENLSRFIITARDILPPSPEDWRTHSPRLPR